jgi:hypothetical protein
MRRNDMGQGQSAAQWLCLFARELLTHTTTLLITGMQAYEFS